jgi:hypothetical protein
VKVEVPALFGVSVMEPPLRIVRPLGSAPMMMENV